MRTLWNRPRWRWLIGGCALLICAAGAAWLAARGSQATARTPATVRVRRATFSQTVTGSGPLAPARAATLAFAIAGQVRSVDVKAGDHVRQGQVLARLDDQAAQYAVQEAQADLDQRIAALAATQSISVTESDLALAQAKVALAQAQLQAAQASAAADTLSGESNLALARTKQQTTEQGDVPAELQAAHLKTQAAELSLAKTRDSASADKTNAQVALDAALDSLAAAQKRYSDAYWLNDQVKRTRRDPNTLKNDAQPESGKLTDNQVRAYEQALDDARLALQQAERAVQNAQLAYDLARRQETNAVQQAEQELADAQQNEATTTASTTRVSLASAHDQVVQNQAALLKQRAANTSTTAGTQSNLAAAQANLLALQHPSAPSASAIAAAQAQLAVARANLYAAQQALSGTVIRAPFDAVVSEVAIAPSSSVAAGAAALTLVDMGRLTVDIAVGESDIVDIAPGLAADLQPAALPGTVLTGTVQTVPISPTFVYGAPSYPLRVVVQHAPAPVRLGMTAAVTITTLAHPDALLVPLEAVQGEGAAATVQRLVDQRISTVPVRLGLQNDTEVEVLGGISEGDTLVLPQSDGETSATSRQSQGGGLFGGGGPPPPRHRNCVEQRQGTEPCGVNTLLARSSPCSAIAAGRC
jgi:RND family efflux transporter MFP subunit